MARLLIDKYKYAQENKQHYVTSLQSRFFLILDEMFTFQASIQRSLLPHL